MVAVEEVQVSTLLEILAAGFGQDDFGQRSHTGVSTLLEILDCLVTTPRFAAFSPLCFNPS